MNPPGDAPERRIFFVGSFIKTDLLISWLEQHNIAATQEPVDPSLPDDGDLDRQMKVFVPAVEYNRAHRLFFEDRGDEL